MKIVSAMIVEYNPDLRTTLRHAFEDHGYMTWTFPSPEIAFSIFSSIQPSVIVLDLDTVGPEAYKMIDRCKELCPNAAIIVEGKSADTECMKETIKHGAQAFLVKPYAVAPLFELLERKIPQDPSLVTATSRAA